MSFLNECEKSDLLKILLHHFPKRQLELFLIRIFLDCYQTEGKEMIAVRMKTAVIIATTAAAFPLFAHAQESKPSAKTLMGFLYVGPTFSNSSDGTVRDSTGASLGSSSENDKGSILVGAEVEGEFSPVLHLSGVLEWQKYKYQDGSPSDTEISLMAVPKVVTHQGSAHVWAGLGLGLTNTRIAQSSGTSAGLTSTLNSTSPISFAISPRVGIDFDFGNVFLGAHLSYITTDVSVDGVINPGAIKFTEDVTRSWYTFAIRVGSYL